MKIKTLTPENRKSFFKSFIKATIKSRRKRAEVKSRWNQKADRVKRRKSFRKPSLQNVLTVDLVNAFIHGDKHICACVGLYVYTFMHIFAIH